VTYESAAPFNGRVIRINIDPGTGNPDNSMPVIEHIACMTSLHGISGRHLVSGEWDMWVIGSLGNRILHSTGTGTWASEVVPTSNALNGVYATPDGHVFVVGFGSTIAHYY
jgi:photosystem II stability/assembly factor-like uncharacterized protein